MIYILFAIIDVAWHACPHTGTHFKSQDTWIVDVDRAKWSLAATGRLSATPQKATPTLGRGVVERDWNHDVPSSG